VKGAELSGLLGARIRTQVGTGQIMTEIIDSSLDRKQPIVVLSGPSFAVELMQGLPTMIVAASDSVELAQHASAMLASPCLRVNLSDDVVGVEIAGALKNVLAIAAGIVEGLQLGNNAMAALTSQVSSQLPGLSPRLRLRARYPLALGQRSDSSDEPQMMNEICSQSLAWSGVRCRATLLYCHHYHPTGTVSMASIGAIEGNSNSLTAGEVICEWCDVCKQRFDDSSPPTRTNDRVNTLVPVAVKIP